jgi:hypothetical protein
MHVGVSRFGCSDYGERLSTVGVKTFQDGNDRRCMKTGLSHSLDFTHEGDLLAHYPAWAQSRQISL